MKVFNYLFAIYFLIHGSLMAFNIVPISYSLISAMTLVSVIYFLSYARKS